MTALAIITALSLLAGLAGVVIAFFWVQDDPLSHDEPPTVDRGWRAFS